ncbi:hypothetical protein BKA62DRAFT_710023 [Auriculariales sp. MPI-PUGE-AT-0066]|nr:hypothetical protein BKA62DRAFT_710023 [Auriculariales sp. MPI-PUGE-AT-0066]
MYVHHAAQAQILQHATASASSASQDPSIVPPGDDVLFFCKICLCLLRVAPAPPPGTVDPLDLDGRLLYLRVPVQRALKHFPCLNCGIHPAQTINVSFSAALTSESPYNLPFPNSSEEDLSEQPSPVFTEALMATASGQPEAIGLQVLSPAALGITARDENLVLVKVEGDGDAAAINVIVAPVSEGVPSLDGPFQEVEVKPEEMDALLQTIGHSTALLGKRPASPNVEYVQTRVKRQRQLRLDGTHDMPQPPTGNLMCCGQFFSTNYEMKRHMRNAKAHVGQATCPICDQPVGKRPDGLLRHQAITKPVVTDAGLTLGSPEADAKLQDKFPGCVSYAQRLNKASNHKRNKKNRQKRKNSGCI